MMIRSRRGALAKDAKARDAAAQRSAVAGKHAARGVEAGLAQQRRKVQVGLL